MFYDMSNRIDLTCFELQDDICDGGLSAGAAAAIIGGISAAGGVASSAIQAGAKWGSSTYMRVAKAMARYNTSLNEEVYNKYQSPEAMMRQYREAGLNPALIYGNASPGGVAAGQVDTDPSKYEGKHTSGEIASAVADAISRYQDVVGKQILNTNAAKAGALTDAQTRTENAKALYYEGENEYNNLVKEYRYEEFRDRVMSGKIDLNIKRQTGLIRAKQDIAESIERVKASKMSRREKKQQIIHLQELDKEIDSNIALNNERIEGMRQARVFEKEYHPLKVLGMKLGNANASLGYQSAKWNLGLQQALSGQVSAIPGDPYYSAIMDRNSKSRSRKLANEVVEDKLANERSLYGSMGRVGKAVRSIVSIFK